MKSGIEKVLAILSLGAMIAAFFLGTMREQDALSMQLKAIEPDFKAVQTIDIDLYEVELNSGDKKFFTVDRYPGYGGIMVVGVLVSKVGVIESVAILSSPDTPTYIQQIWDLELPLPYLGATLLKAEVPDSISGATLSSDALKISIEKASNNLIASEEAKALGANFGFSQAEIDKAVAKTEELKQVKLSSTEWIKIAVVCMFFLLALVITSKKFTYNKKVARYALLVVSIGLMGFLYSMQFSLSTIVMLVSGAWLQGLASYAPLICLILAIIIFVVTKKNLYCSHICPFGAIQEAVALISNCKNPEINHLTRWGSRLFALGLMCMALYFSNSSLATYEPFGKVFGFIGSITFFALSITATIGALFVRMPWCRLFCPVTPFFDYIQFWRSWLFGKKKKQEKAVA